MYRFLGSSIAQRDQAGHALIAQMQPNIRVLHHMHKYVATFIYQLVEIQVDTLIVSCNKSEAACVQDDIGCVIVGLGTHAQLNIELSRCFHIDNN